MALVALVLRGRPQAGGIGLRCTAGEYHVVLRPRRYLAAQAGCMGLSKLARMFLSPMMRRRAN
jgi:hypothetical protein